MAFELDCSNCGATNRVPAERLEQGPKCGKCGTRLGVKVSAADAQKIESIFQQAFATSNQETRPPSQPEARPAPKGSAIWCSLRHVGYDQSHAALGGRSKRIRAGLWGLLLGAPITAAGTIAGTLVMNMILGVLNVQGSVTLPNVVLAAAYAGALYGFMVTTTGTERLLSTIIPETFAGVGRIVRLFALVVVGFSLLIAVWMIVHTYGLAEFSL